MLALPLKASRKTILTLHHEAKQDMISQVKNLPSHLFPTDLLWPLWHAVQLFPQIILSSLLHWLHQPAAVDLNPACSSMVVIVHTMFHKTNPYFFGDFFGSPLSFLTKYSFFFLFFILLLTARLMAFGSDGSNGSVARVALPSFDILTASSQPTTSAAVQAICHQYSSRLLT
jgi:hypothetical protein